MNNARIGVSPARTSAFSLAFSRRFWRSIARGFMGYYWRSIRHVTVHRWALYFRLKIAAITHSQGRLEEWMESRLRLWVGGEQLFSRLEKLIRKARQTIIVQMFIWKDDALGRQVASLLLEAAERGVHVDITKDAVGDSFELNQDFLSTRDRTQGIWQRFWSHPRIAVHYGSSVDHTKAFLFDGKTLLVGGMNIGNEYLSDWRDYFVELRSRRFVEGFLSGEGMASPQGSVVLVMNSHRRMEMRSALTRLLEGAEKRILLEQCYLSDAAMIHLLAKKSREGIRVTVILPSHADVHAHANMRAIAQLLTSGDPRKIRVFLYPGMFHAKVVLVDRKRAFIGSANLTTYSLDWMGEANVLVNRGHLRVLHRLRQALRRDIRISRLLEEKPRLSVFGKALAWLGL